MNNEGIPQNGIKQADVTLPIPLDVLLKHKLPKFDEAVLWRTEQDIEISSVCPRLQSPHSAKFKAFMRELQKKETLLHYKKRQ